MNHLATNLLYLRKLHSYSYDRLADISKVPNSVLWRIEKGTTPDPGLQTLIKLVTVFQIPLDDLIFKDLSK